MTNRSLDEIDRKILNALQQDFPICARPFEAAGASLEIAEELLISRLAGLLDCGVLSRFGPLYDAEKLGGAVTLVAMAVPEARFEEVATLVNAHPEVAHNYARDHALNMWFVLAVEESARIGEVLAAIEAETGLKTINLPKEEEFFLELKLSA